MTAGSQELTDKIADQKLRADSSCEGSGTGVGDLTFSRDHELDLSWELTLRGIRNSNARDQTLGCEASINGLRRIRNRGAGVGISLTTSIQLFVLLVS